MNKRKYFVLITILALFIIILPLSKNLSPGTQPHIREAKGNELRLSVPMTKDEIIKLADFIILGDVTKIIQNQEWGKDLVTISIQEDLKSEATGEMVFYADLENFTVAKKYLVFVQETDVVTFDQPIKSAILEYVWEISGNRLNYLPADFKEYTKYSELKDFIIKSKSINSYISKVKVITQFSGMDEKFANSPNVFVAKIKEITDESPVKVIVIDEPTKVYKKNVNTNAEIPKNYIINGKFNVEVGDTVLMFTNGYSLLAAKKDCLLIKGEDIKWEDNQNFLERLIDNITQKLSEDAKFIIIKGSAQVPTDKAGFAKRIKEYQTPYVITIRGESIVKIAEQYVP